MRYPHTYSLLLVLSIFAVLALSGCDRASIRPNPQELPLADIPATLIDITPESFIVAAPPAETEEQTTEENAPVTNEAADNALDTSAEAVSDTASEAKQADQKVEDETVETARAEEPSLESLIYPVYFALDEYQLSEEDKLRLTSLAEQMLRPENSHLRLRIEGHCDDRGTREYNFALGERRAASVARFLKIKGLEASRIHTISYGKERPVAFGTSEAVRAQNRRAQMTILMKAKN